MPTGNFEQPGADAAVAGLAEQDALAALLWTWSIGAADVYGILPAQPRGYAALVAPALRITPGRVGAAIEAQAGAGLVTVYQAGGLGLLYLHHHHRYRPARWDRAGPPQYPLPPSWEIPQALRGCLARGGKPEEYGLEGVGQDVRPAPATSRSAQFGDAPVAEPRQTEGLPESIASKVLAAPRLPQMASSGRDRSDPRIRRAAEALHEAGVVDDAELTASRLRRAVEVLPGWERFLEAEVEQLVVRARVGDHVRLSYLPLNIKRRLDAGQEETAAADAAEVERQGLRHRHAMAQARELLADWPEEQVRAIMRDSGYGAEEIEAALAAAEESDDDERD